jgi:thiosulfate dehydrogenase (quinone) large subunit
MQHRTLWYGSPAVMNRKQPRAMHTFHAPPQHDIDRISPSTDVPLHTAAPYPSAALQRQDRRALPTWLAADLQRPEVFLVPVRVFIGLGWLRAGAEKLIDPSWYDGAALTTFLLGQLQSGAMPFPFYATLTHDLFLPHVAGLSWIVIVGQLLAGLAILCGGLTNLALLGGLAMNLNFLLAGEPSPSAFYLIIQVALLLAHSGAVLGADRWLGQSWRLPWLAAQPLPRHVAQAHLWPAIGAVGLAGGAALYGLAHIRDYSLAGSVHDPAVILTIFAALCAGWAGLVGLRRYAAVAHTSAESVTQP